MHQNQFQSLIIKLKFRTPIKDKKIKMKIVNDVIEKYCKIVQLNYLFEYCNFYQVYIPASYNLFLSF